MLINWYPGHMHKAQKKVREIMPLVDAVIEVIDARLPFSSANPMIENLRKNKPFLKILSKSDLADEQVTDDWIRLIQKSSNGDAISISKDKPKITLSVPTKIRALVGNPEHSHKTIKALILGIPNVGKSTLINTLAGKKIAAVGNEPAITKGQQKIRISDDIHLIDSPGMTWPGSKNETVNYRLALSGAIRDTALEYDDVGMFAIEFLLERYPERVQKCYGVAKLDREPWQVLEDIAKTRGCMSGRSADFKRVGELVVRELRSGKLGRLSIERPGDETGIDKIS
jgi:ribosome biogenesis GTPase A